MPPPDLDGLSNAELKALVADLLARVTELTRTVVELREDLVSPRHFEARLGVGLYVPLVDQIQLKLGAAYRFDSKPILDSVKKGDLVLIWGLAYHVSLPE